MKTILCPFCETPVEINLKYAVDEDGEVYVCPNCHNYFRYVER